MWKKKRPGGDFVSMPSVSLAQMERELTVERTRAGLAPLRVSWVGWAAESAG